MRLSTHTLLVCVAMIVASTVACGCQRIDDRRLPPVAVNIPFTSVGLWDKYGVSGAYGYRYFIKNANMPTGFPYTGSMYTGFGGVLLVGDLFGNLLAYDMACPVEANPGVKVYINKDTYEGECEKCHSTYDVFGGYGRPTSGEAAQYGYGLTRYKVIDGGGALVYRMITN